MTDLKAMPFTGREVAALVKAFKSGRGDEVQEEVSNWYDYILHEHGNYTIRKGEDYNNFLKVIKKMPVVRNTDEGTKTFALLSKPHIFEGYRDGARYLKIEIPIFTASLLKNEEKFDMGLQCVALSDFGRW